MQFPTINFKRIFNRAFAQAAFDHTKPAAKALIASYVDKIPNSIPLDNAKTEIVDAIEKALYASLGHNPLLDDVTKYVVSVAGTAVKFALPDNYDTVRLKAQVLLIINSRIDDAKI